MANLILTRQKDDGIATLGELHLAPAPGFLCYTLEPAWKGNAVGESCIPVGRYPLQRRAEGGYYADYTGKWDWHKEMVEIVVPGRTFILFHVGNFPENTDGCVLVGDGKGHRAGDKALAVWNSARAYKRIYPELREAAANGGHLEVIDAR